MYNIKYVLLDYIRASYSVFNMLVEPRGNLGCNMTQVLVKMFRTIFILLFNLVHVDLQLIRSPLFILSTYEGVISSDNFAEYLTELKAYEIKHPLFHGHTSTDNKRWFAADHLEVAPNELGATAEELNSVALTRQRLRLLKAQQLLSPLRRAIQRTASSHNNVLISILVSQPGAKAQRIHQGFSFEVLNGLRTEDMPFAIIVPLMCLIKVGHPLQSLFQSVITLGSGVTCVTQVVPINWL